MTDRLVVVDGNYRFYIQWELGGGEDMGAVLGEGGEKDYSGEAPTDRGDYEHWIACKTISEMSGIERDDKGFFFDSHSRALRGKQLANFSMKQDRPLPDWARKATEQGWKAPRGWKA